jgi:hypothetical protein
MAIDASGDFIWVSSFTHFEYMVLEAKINTVLNDDTLFLLLDEQFVRLDWPCGDRSYGYGDDSGDFVCVKKGLTIAFIFIIKENADPPKEVSEFLNIISSAMQKKVKIFSDKIKELDPKASVNASRISIQRASVTG